MTTVRDRIIAAAEPVFDRHGFAGTGVDRLTAAASVSSRTLYKHLGSKTGVIVAVLGARCGRFERVFDVNSIEQLFDSLGSWFETEGSRGCLFLRAMGEGGEFVPEVAETVQRYRETLHGTVARVIEHETGGADELLIEQLLVLIEGAAAAASYRGERAVRAARALAVELVSSHRRPATERS